MNFVFRMMAIAVIAIAGIFNAQPILELTRQLFDKITNVPFAWLLSSVGMGWLLSLIGRLLVDFVGIGFWALLQGCEMLPSIIKGDLAVLQILIRSFSRFKEEVVTGSDSAVVVDLKKRHNKLPKIWLQQANALRFVAYVIEFSLSFIRFPPYAGGLPGLIADLPLSASITKIQWENFGWMLATIFSFELLVGIISWVIKGRTNFNFGGEPQSARQSQGQRQPQGAPGGWTPPQGAPRQVI